MLTKLKPRKDQDRIKPKIQIMSIKLKLRKYQDEVKSREHKQS